jgi:tellurium resistance protein TerD
MAINLQKGQKISLSKESPGLAKVMCGLGWDIAQKTGGGVFSRFSASQDFDLDASVIAVNEQGKLVAQENVIYYSNKQHPSGSIVHHGDNLTGAGEGDDEQVTVDLNRIPSAISKLIFVVTIYDSVGRRQDFGQVKNAFVRLVNATNKQEIARYNLSGQDYANATSMIMAEVYKHNGEWKMAAIGDGFNVSGLGDILKMYT